MARRRKTTAAPSLPKSYYNLLALNSQIESLQLKIEDDIEGAKDERQSRAIRAHWRTTIRRLEQAVAASDKALTIYQYEADI